MFIATDIKFEFKLAKDSCALCYFFWLSTVHDSVQTIMLLLLLQQ